MPRSGGVAERAAQRVRITFGVLGDLGADTTVAIVANSLQALGRRRRERRGARVPSTPRTPGLLRDVVPVPGGARCRFSEAELEIVFVTSDVVRVSWGPDRPPPPRGFPDPPPAEAAVPFEVGVVAATGGSGCRVSTTGLALNVSADGGIRYSDPTGRTVRVESPPIRRGPTRVLRSALRPGEHVAGLGERAAPLDLRGGRYRLWNRDPGGAWGPGSDPLYCGIPVLVGMHRDADVLVFHDNSHYGVVAIDGSGGRPVGSGVVEVRLAGGMARHYVSTGTLPQLLERYAALTGLPRLPPRWALGYQHCRWGYRSQEEIEAVSAGFEREGVPLSALYLDIDYMEGYRVFTVDPARFADLPAMCAHLEMRGTRLVTIVDPGVKVDQSYPVYREGLEAGHFVRDADGQPVIGVVWPGRSAFPDFTSPRTRDWWARWYARLLDAGVTGLWHDMNEPTSIALAGDPTLPRSTPHDLEGRGGTHLEAHNVYGLDMDRAGWEGARRARPDRRPFVVSRAGWAGVQRWAWIWTGDAESTWHGLRQQVATALGLGLSGVPFTGSDIGGFSGDPGPELYVRWLELSMFVPFCRTHSVVGAPGREPWRFAAPYREIIGRLIRARYRLLPYLYTVAWEASETGHPVMRPLYWNPAGSSPAPDVDPPDDRADDQFLVGDDLLVAPVTAPGRDSRRVWLPAGAWYPWDAAGGAEVVASGPEAPLAGGTIVDGAAPLGAPAVHVRAGSVLPLDDGWWPARAGQPATVPHDHRALAPALHCWLDGQGRARGVRYDDAGDGEGAGRVDRFELEPEAGGASTAGSATGADAGGSGPAGTARSLVLRRESDGSFPTPESTRLVVHGAAVHSAEVDGERLPVVAHPGGGWAVECRGGFRQARFETDLPVGPE